VLTPRRAAHAVTAALLAAAALPSAAGAVTVTADPELRPEFQGRITDYVTRCVRGEAVRFKIDASDGASVRVDGARPRTGSFAKKVELGNGQATTIVVRKRGHRHSYHVRCLPPSFPHWYFNRHSPPRAQWYLLAPSGGADRAWSHYVTIIDGRGVPVWWSHRNAVPFNAQLLPSGEIAWARWYNAGFAVRDEAAWEVHRLGGAPVRTLRTAGSPTDAHDMTPLANGHYLLVTYRLRRHVDLSAYGGGEDDAVYDGEVQELDANGRRVWSWNSKDHIDIGENVLWTFARGPLPDGTEAYDYFHLNSVEPDGDGLVISARHVNAVYRVDRSTGDVVWKLGGTHRPESLDVVGDGYPEPFIGQHDARLLPDGTLTVFDNHSFRERPRGVRFRIDAAAGTATVLDQATDPKVPLSPAEGSARRLPGGDWVVSWGSTPVLSEISPSGGVVWRLSLWEAQNYRVQPIGFGRLEPSRLRRAMDRMHPRGQ
jgi:Arylsulfotransferase (ASST)